MKDLCSKPCAATNARNGGSSPNMATYSSSPRFHAVDPTTPVHSPHHSLHSSSSSRLSLRNNLTLHEYRKQQNSPASHATPPGRALRRKPAASGLKETESAPLVSRTPLSSSRVPPQSLHLSHSVRIRLASLALTYTAPSTQFSPNYWHVYFL